MTNAYSPRWFVWAVRLGVNLGEVEAAFHTAKRLGLELAGAIAAREAPGLGLDAGFCRRYLDTIITYYNVWAEHRGVPKSFTLVRYEADRAKDLRLAATNGIDAAMKQYELDALLFPGPSGAAIAAKPGYPTVIVPFGTVPNSAGPAFPTNFEPKPAPFGVAFTGMACSEPRLIALAYAFEQATKRRVPPPLR